MLHAGHGVWHKMSAQEMVAMIITITAKNRRERFLEEGTAQAESRGSTGQ